MEFLGVDTIRWSLLVEKLYCLSRTRMLSLVLARVFLKIQSFWGCTLVKILA